MVLKNPPFAAPLTTTNAMSGPSEVETGQMTNMLTALSTRARRRVFTGPMKSDRKPHRRRPTAEEKLNPATRPAAVDEDRPTDLLYNGRKKGGTNRGKVPIAPARKSVEKRTFLNKLLL